MDKYIDSRFERLEKALASLIDSVTKYHPSIIQAEELKAADADLSKGLEQGKNFTTSVALKCYRLTARLLHSPNASEQFSANPEASTIVCRSRLSNPRHAHQPRQHAQRYCYHPNHHLPVRTQLPHRIRRATQLCAPDQQNDAPTRRSRGSGHHITRGSDADTDSQS